MQCSREKKCESTTPANSVLAKNLNVIRYRMLMIPEIFLEIISSGLVLLMLTVQNKEQKT